MKQIAAIVTTLSILSGCASGMHNFVTSVTATGETAEDFNLGVMVTRHLPSPLSPSNNGLMALAIDAQRQVVIASQEEGDIVAEVLTEVGAQSSIFGTDGIVTAGFDTADGEYMWVGDIAVVRSEDRLSTGFVITGHRVSSTGITAIALARFSIRGLDPGFGTGGKVITRIPTFESQRANSLAFTRSGQILVAGSTTPSGFPMRSAVLRYHPDGRLDTLFGTSGVAQIAAPGGGWAAGEAVAIDSRDRIVVVGGSGRSEMIARLDRTGRIDTSFGRSGIVMLEPIGDGSLTPLRSVAIDDLDRVVVVTSTQESERRVVVFRLTPSGELDTGFGDGGRVLVSAAQVAPDLAIDSRGRIVVVGASSDTLGAGQMVIARILPSGRFDTSFSGDGILMSDSPSTIPRSVAIGRNDSIVVGGVFFRD